ncbi:MAG: YciI family protein [Bifidobacteriaceae bacterium]|jgi:uncharacterized protein YciI|nr:YciI family protein [Bifidobacteriaceae bacterium]
MAFFAVHYRYGADAPAVAGAKPAHRAYLADLLDRGLLAASGPLTDAPEGLLIFHAESANQVADLIAADPINLAGLVEQATIRPWSPNLGPFTDD